MNAFQMFAVWCMILDGGLIAKYGVPTAQTMGPDQSWFEIFLGISGIGCILAGEVQRHRERRPAPPAIVAEKQTGAK
jgi:hypothetical protein